MGKQSNDSDKYKRYGIALPHERIVTFEGRLAELGLETLGELATVFILGDGAVEALKPVVERYKQAQSSKKSVAAQRKEVIARLKSLEPSALEELMAKLDSKATPA